MNQLARFAPPTQLDALRALLGGYFDGDHTFQPQLEQSLRELQRMALQDLGQSLTRSTTPSGLRHCILKAISTFDWPGWDIHLIAMLQQEEDPALFAEGCACLSALSTRGALSGLERLKGLRHDPEQQAVLMKELDHYVPQQPFEACLEGLLRESAAAAPTPLNARRLVSLSRAEHLPALLDAFGKGSPAAAHWLLRILAFLPEVDGGDALLGLFRQLQGDSDETRQLQDFLMPLENLPDKAQRDLVLAQAGTRFAACTPAWLDTLRASMAYASHSPAPDLAPLQEAPQGPFDAFLVKALTCLAQGRSLGFHALIRDTVASLPSRITGQTLTMGDLAALLAAKVEAKELALNEVLPLLEQAYRAHLGGTSLRVAYLSLIPGTDQESLDRLLTEPDAARRIQAIEGLGSRENDLLAPFFFKAMSDPVKEVAQTAIRQLGKLASGLPAMMDLFRSGQTDRVREAIHFFRENHQQAAVKPLMGFLSADGADDELLVDAAQALGHLGDPVATRALLSQLHGGKPLSLQVALVEALTLLRTPEASLGLLKCSENLRLPDVLLLALNGVLSGFPSFEQPLPPAQVPDLERLVDRCWGDREGSGHWLGTTAAMDGLYVFDPAFYQRLADRFTQCLVDMRHKPTWDRASHDLIQRTIRTMSRRAASLSSLEDREKAIQACLESMPETGSKRTTILFQLWNTLSDPEQVLGEACVQTLLAFLARELLRDDLDFAEMELLCRIAEQSGHTAMIDPLEDLYAHTQRPGLKASARKALLALGLTEADIQRRKPIRTILLFEPNAFFRGRLLSAMAGCGRTVSAAATRQEAEAIMAEHSVDLLISEIHDDHGDLWPWLEGNWQQRRCRYLLLATAQRDRRPLAGLPWLIGVLYKPFPLGELLRVIAD